MKKIVLRRKDGAFVMKRETKGRWGRGVREGMDFMDSMDLMDRAGGWRGMYAVFAWSICARVTRKVNRNRSLDGSGLLFGIAPSDHEMCFVIM